MAPNSASVRTSRRPERREEVVPLAVLVELSRRKDRRRAAAPRQMLTAPASQATQIDEQLNIFREQAVFSIAADLLEVLAAHEYDAGVDVQPRQLRQHNRSHDASDRDEHRKRQESARRSLVETKSCGSADDPIGEDTIDFVERVGMNDRIGVDEREGVALGDRR